MRARTIVSSAVLAIASACASPEVAPGVTPPEAELETDAAVGQPRDPAASPSRELLAASRADDPVLAELRGLLEAARSARKSGEFAAAREQISAAIDQALVRLEERDDVPGCVLLEEMGRFALEAGELHEAERAFVRAVEVRSRTQTEDHPDVQTARLDLARTTYMLGDIQGARALIEVVLEVYSRTIPDEHPDFQRARQNLAVMLKGLGDLQGARTLFERVLDVMSRTRPADDPELQKVRGNLAVTIRALGDLQAARALLEKALEVQARTLPEDHPDLAATRLNLAATLDTLGDSSAARPLLEAALEVQSRTRPEDHPDLQTARLNYALLIGGLGDLQASRGLIERVLAVRSRTLPDDHPDLQLARLDLAATVYALGDLPSARTLLERVLEVQSRALPDDHPDLQAARSGLAVTLWEMGDLKGARALQEKVFEVLSRTLPDDHPNLHEARLNLANTIEELGDLEGARTLQEHVLEVRSRTLPDDHPDLQATRHNLAATLWKLDEFEGACALLEKVLEIQTRTLPDDHRSLQVARGNLAWTIAADHARKTDAPGGAAGRPADREAARKRCKELVLSLCAGQVGAARQALLSSSAREARATCESLAWGLDTALSIAGGCGAFGPIPELDSACFDLSETTRGALLAAALLMRQAGSAPDYSELRSELRRVSGELAGLAQGGTTSADFQDMLERRDGIQRELARRARELAGGPPAGMEFDAESLVAKLSDTEAVVGFRRYLRASLESAGEEKSESEGPRVAQSVPSLCALVVRRRHDGEAPNSAFDLARVELGPAAPIQAAVKAWRESLGVGTESRGITPVAEASVPETNEDRGRALRRLVFDPLLPELGGTDRVILTLDDVLHLVAFDALPLDEHDPVQPSPALLGDRWRIEIRATLGELLAPARPLGSGGELVAIGAVAYGAARDDGQEGILRGGPWSAGFSALPATRAEVGEIARELRDQRVQAEVTLLEGSEATRENLLELAPRARWLHVATHGWFARESIRSWEDPEPLDRLTGFAHRAPGAEQIKGMSPMLLCGLALSGANLPEDGLGRVPGLLTAEELSTLDLSNCELAVLSACDTSVGERRAGQGVASLQMALQMAGARSVITSLWKVPDEATRELMTDFYRRIWVEKKPKWQALWEAKMKIRDARVEAGRPRYSTRDWAAWVLTGDPD